jgi:hypothetical protein
MDSATYRLSQVIRGSPQYMVVITLLLFVQVMSMLLFIADYFSYLGPFYPSVWTGIYFGIIGITFVFAARAAQFSSLRDMYDLYQHSLLPFKVLYSMLLWFVFLWTVSTVLSLPPLEITVLEGVFVQISGVFYLSGQLIHLVLLQVLLWNPADYKNIQISEVLEKTTEELENMDDEVKQTEPETPSSLEQTEDSDDETESSSTQKS